MSIFLVMGLLAAFDFRRVPRACNPDLGAMLIRGGATDSNGKTKVFSLDIKTRSVNPVSRETGSVVWFRVDPSSSTLVLFSERGRTVPATERSECINQGCLVVDETLEEALAAVSYNFGGAAYSLKDGSRTELETPESSRGINFGCRYSLFGAMSPDGRYAIQTCSVRTWPSSWEGLTADRWVAGSLKARNVRLVRQFFLIDLQSGKSRPLIDAPALLIGDRDPIWVGPRTVLVVGAPLPEPSGLQTGVATLGKSWGVVEVNVATGTQKTIYAMPKDAGRIVGAKWNDTVGKLCFMSVSVSGESRQNIALVRRGAKWSKAGGGCGEETGPAPDYNRVFVREALGSRPVLVWKDRPSATGEVLLDPNTWLDSYDLGAVRKIGWTAPDGRSWVGDMYLPPDYTAGKRYPVVLAPHGARSGDFSLDWRVRNFPARPLAARGVIVLQIEERDASTALSLAEPKSVRIGMESAIDYLAEKGFADRSKIGILGWSRAGWAVDTLLTQSAYPVAAGMTIDSDDFGWWSYLADGALREYEQDYESAPFGEGMKNWLEHSPSFNLNRIRTPLLMWRGNSVYGKWDFYAGMKRLNLPVEFWVFPDSVHDLFKVRQRIAATELMVDWFDFWLNGKEDQNSTKHEQYVRWRELRQLQARALQQPRPPLLNWQATPSYAK